MRALRPFFVTGLHGITYVAVALCVFSAACSHDSSGRWFERPKTSQQWLDMALEAPNADDRRRGVLGLSQGPDGATDWAMKVYDTVARTDKDTMVRCAAVKAMGPAANSGQVSAILKIVSSQTQRFPDVHPAAGPLRWEAARVLLAIVENQRYEPAQRGEIVKTLLERLARDGDRNVRLTVIDTLAYFAEQPVPAALIDVLDEEDFAIQRAAENSLIALTGITHHHDAKAWRAWLASAKDPFEKAGQTPEGIQTTNRRSHWRWDWEF